MGHHQRREASAAHDLLRQAEHLLGAPGIERRGVLVQQQELRPLQRGHQQRQRLALAAGEQADGRVEPVLESRAEPLDLLRDLAPALAAERRPRPPCRVRCAASARFSATVMLGAVPLNGFWNTRPISVARRCSGQRVMSFPSRRIVPWLGVNDPATALSRVDFPGAVGAEHDDEGAPLAR